MAQLPDLATLNPQDPNFLAAAIEYQRRYELAQQQQVQNPGQLADTLNNLGDRIATQGITDLVPTYSGKPREIIRWLKNVEKHVLLTFGRLDDRECKATAYRRCETAVSDFLAEYFRLHQNATWPECKAELKRRFGETVDIQTKILRLKKFRQKPLQSCQVFSEALAVKALEIYEDDIDHVFIQRDLVSIYCQGLSSRSVARKVLEENPRTLSEATAAALRLTEQQNRLVAHGLSEEPMEVNKVEGKTKTFPKRNQGTTSYSYQWKDGKPVCWKCKGIGHLGRSCQKDQKQTN